LNFSIAQAFAMAKVLIDQDQTAFREGNFARALGRSLNSNPHSPMSEAAFRWDEGWRLIDKPIHRGSRLSALSRIKPMAEPRLAPSGNDLQGRVGREKLSRQFYLVYLGFCVAFGAFLLLMLMHIARLNR
jgi:hypothetical protein